MNLTDAALIAVLIVGVIALSVAITLAGREIADALRDTRRPLPPVQAPTRPARPPLDADFDADPGR